MKKVVLKLSYHDNKCKQKAMMTASGVSGVESVSLDKDQKMTVIGDIDPVIAATKLRKLCHTEILSVGPAKEPEKKKDEPKKEEAKKPQETKKDPPKQTVTPTYPCTVVYQPPLPAYYYPDYLTNYKIVQEDHSPACTIC